MTMSLFTLELRKSDFLISEEVVVSRLKVHLGISESKTVNFFQPHKFVFVLSRSVVKFQPGILVMFDFISKHTIVDKSNTAKRLSKQHLLLGIRVYSKFICFVCHTGHSLLSSFTLFTVVRLYTIKSLPQFIR